MPATSTATVATAFRIYRPAEGRIYVINELGANDGGLGAADFSYLFGNPGDKPFVGDFNGDGIDTVGLHRESTGFVYFRQSLTTGIADSSFFFGDPGDRLVSGDWGIVDNVDTPASSGPPLTTILLQVQQYAGQRRRTDPHGLVPTCSRWRAPGRSSSVWEGCCRSRSSGSRFAQQLSPVGGTPPYTVTKLGGPAFLSVDNSGVVFGTPPSLGTLQPHRCRVTDSTGKTADQTFPLTVQDGCDSSDADSPRRCLALVDIYRKTGGHGWAD